MELRIKELCKEKGLTLQQVAEYMGVNRVSLSNSINGNPTIGTLEKVAAALNVEIVDLFAKRGDFVAFVRHNGETHTFDTKAELIEYAETLKAL
ncbi:MAG: helix-turn-helix transcriptional regulator [Alistipes sp.]|jgi:transcriptional regulator with XRE-family HTH domain